MNLVGVFLSLILPMSLYWGSGLYIKLYDRYEISSNKGKLNDIAKYIYKTSKKYHFTFYSSGLI